MQNYRLYLLDHAGHIRGPAIELTAVDDKAAAALGEGAMELWQRDRLIQRFEAHRKEA